jgi:hypothetical protein
MRPLKINPGHDITGLALSPDGQQLGVVQSSHGFRMFDALTGAELARDTSGGSDYETSPTGRHAIEAFRSEVRLAEVTTGRPRVPFQSGWVRAGDFNQPPAEPGTSAIPSVVRLSSVDGFDRWRAVNRPPGTPLAFDSTSLYNAALTADHRFALGRAPRPNDRVIVCDLARSALVASDLDLTEARIRYSPVHTAFTPDVTRIVAVTRRALAVFELPPLGLSALDLPVIAPVLHPALVVPLTLPQPDPNPPPFAILPDGHKILVRGERSRIELRSLATGEVETVWKWQLPRVNALAVAADGLTAVAGGLSGLVVIWDLD